jgi:hypothetical protein
VSHTASEPSASVRSAKRSVDESPVYRRLVRVGFVSRAVTYAVIGGLALALALGAGTDHTAPNQQGALSLIARSPIGRAALIVIAAGLLAYALWKLEQGIFSRGPEGAGGRDVKDRIVNIAGGLVYVGFFLVATRAVTDGGGNSSGAPRHTAAGVLGWPGGPLLVGLAGLAFVAITIAQIYIAVSGQFLQNLKTDKMDPGRRALVATLGRVGQTARALVFGLVGYFLIRTALDYDPRKAVGVDGALAHLHSEPYGSWLVGAVAVGLLVFAAYSLFEARYRRL